MNTENVYLNDEYMTKKWEQVSLNSLSAKYLLKTYKLLDTHLCVGYQLFSFIKCVPLIFITCVNPFHIHFSTVYLISQCVF